MKRAIKKAPIRDQIYDIIKDGILTGKYQPGTRLSIATLSKELDVSNSPVREAVSMLARDGLIDIYPNSGPSVIRLSERRLSDIAQAILSMLFGAFEICLRIDKLDQLIELLQKALKEQIAHLDVENIQEYVTYSICFENAFIQCCDNSYITKQYTEIKNLFFLVVLYNHRHIEQNRNHAVIEHQKILGALIEGDFTQAKDLLAEHYSRFQISETM